MTTNSHPEADGPRDGGDASGGSGDVFGAGLGAAATSSESQRPKARNRAASTDSASAGSKKKSTRRKRSSRAASSSEATESAGDGERESSRPRAKRASKRTPRRKASSGEAEAPAESASDGESGERSERPARRKRAGRGRRSTASADESRGSDDTTADAGDASESTAGSESASEGTRAPRRKRKSSSRRRTPAAETDSDAGEDASDSQAPAAAGRSGRRRRGRGSETESSDRPTDSGGDEGASEEGAGPKRRRRGSRGGRRRKGQAEAPVGVDAIPGEDDDLEELPPETELVEPGRQLDEGEESGASTRGRGSRRRSGAKAGKSTRSRAKASDADEDEQPKKSIVKRDQVILVNAHDPEETRVAVVGGGLIHDFHMSVDGYDSYVNDIYRGRVVNLESAIGAAFVDFGQGRNGFLHASDVMVAYGQKGFKLQDLLTARLDEDEASEVGDADVSDVSDDEEEDDGDTGKGRGRGRGRGKAKGRAKPAKAQRRTRRPRMPIESLLKKGQMVVSQITKDAIGDKGPTLTTYISIPGRYLVLMPSLARTGVSRKIDDEKERKRLKRILQGLDIPEGMGVIVRTAGTGKLKRDIKRDLDYLIAVWEDFSKRLKAGRNPMPLYQESDVAIRTMRDLFSERTDRVIVDDKEVYERVLEFTRELMPEHEDRIVLHEGGKPLFHEHGVEQDFEKIFSRRVELPSGGSIVFDQTEALVAIDVNSGRTREDGAEFEDIALKTNLEAVSEISRQMRLRDLGGIIVCDFIDMMRMSSRRAVEKAVRDGLAPDRARNKIGRISQFGLLELTRQRLGPGLSKLLYEPCQRCRGTGRQRNATSKAQAILRRLGSALVQKGFSTVEVRAHPETVHFLQEHCRPQLDELAHSSGRELTMTEVPDQVEDSVLRYLRADGREVRPGGRRKR